jgi:signal transduction histidine kinase
MTATSKLPASPTTTLRARRPEPPAARILAVGLAGLVIGLLATGWEEIATTVATHGWELLVWAILVVTVDLFPIALGHIRLTLDLPILLTTALLYPPEVAAALGLLAALDLREIRREVDPISAVFNRAQIAMSIYLAGLTFGGIAGGLSVSATAITATLAALAVDFVANVTLVSFFVVLRARGDFKAARRQFQTANPILLVVTHLGYGVLAFYLAVTSQAMGLWSVALFLAPIVAARQLLIRNEQLRSATRRVRERESLLEQLFKGTIRERRDERIRIASDLHDDVLQIVTRIQQITSTLRTRVGLPLSAADSKELDEAATAGMNSLRHVMQGLKGSPLGTSGLVPTVHTLVRDWKVGQSANVHLTSPPRIEGNEEILLAAYQVVREGLANAIEHSAARRIEVFLAQEEETLKVGVRDDGHGFDPSRIDGSKHFGLALVGERVALANGTLELTTSALAGTQITAFFPCGGQD